MPVREFTGQLDGPRVREFTGELDPPGTQFAAPAQTKRGTRQRVPYMERVSAAAGVPVQPRPDLSWKERGDLGLSDTFEEKRAKFLAKNPAGTFTQVQPEGGLSQETIYQRSPIDPWYMADEPGLAGGDLLDRLQELFNVPAQAATALLGPPGWMAQAGLQAGVTGLTHLVKEAGEEMRGYQQQPWSQVLGTAGMEAGGDLLIGGAASAIPAFIRGPGREAAASISKDLASIEDMMQMDPNLVEPMLSQLRPDYKIVGRLAAQAASTSPVMTNRLLAQEEQFSRMISDLTERRMEIYGRQLEDVGKSTIANRRAQLSRQFDISPEEAGYAITGVFTDTFNKKSREQINKAYKRAGALAEGVSFDLSGAQATARRLTAPTGATATDIVDVIDPATGNLSKTAVETYINVAASPGERVNRVASLLSQIDPQQANWEVVKELRTQVGEAIKDLPLEDAASGKAKAIFGDLTRTIENPVGGGKEFVNAWRQANNLARDRFQVFEDSRVLRLLKEKDAPAAVAKMAAEDPTMLNPMIREVIDNYSPDTRDLYRKTIQKHILGAENAQQGLRQWERGNEDALKWLFKDSPASIEQFRETARAMDQLKKAPINEFIESSQAMIDRGRTLFSKIGPGELKQTIAQLGGQKSSGVTAMRLMAFDDIITPSITFRNGMPFLDSGKLNKAILDAKKRGIWDQLLTDRDHRVLTGMDAYLRRVFKSMKDTGTSLEQAQAVAALKHPSTFLQGVHALTVNNRVIAPLMMSPTATKLFAKAGAGRNAGKRGTVPGMTFLGNFVTELLRLNNSEAGREAEPAQQ